VEKADHNLVIRITTAERDRDMLLDGVDCAMPFGDGNWPGYKSRLLIDQIAMQVASRAVAGHSRAEILQNRPLIHRYDPDQRRFSWTDWLDQRSSETKTIDAGITVTNQGTEIHQTFLENGIALGGVSQYSYREDRSSCAIRVVK
jgi:LysR family transcriptional regulator, glycine cleavage system transcriptional activator